MKLNDLNRDAAAEKRILLSSARKAYVETVEALGPDLGGFSLRDLIADMFPYIRRSEIEEIVEDLRANPPF